jgi:predicted nucleic acid-binding Zn ribbon protein
MPLYGYEPIVQDTTLTRECCYFETLQSLREDPLTHCPTCHTPIQRTLGRFYTLSTNTASTTTSTDAILQEKPSPEDSSSKKAARLALNHVCSNKCRH